MNKVCVFVLCFLLLCAVCALGQVQSNTGPPHAVTAMLPDQLDQATAAVVDAAPCLAPAVFTQNWPLAKTSEPLAPEVWKVSHRSTVDTGAGPIPIPPFRIGQVNPLGAKLNVDQKARQRI